MVISATVSQRHSYPTAHNLDVLEGNLHLNVVAQAYSQEIQDALEPFIYEVVGALPFDINFGPPKFSYALKLPTRAPYLQSMESAQ